MIGRIDFVQKSREAAGADSCYVLRKLVHDAYGSQRLARADAALAEAGLGDCVRYGHFVTRIH